MKITPALKLLGTAAFITTLMVTSVGSYAWANESYPNKDIKFIVPFGAGGGSDVLSRTIIKVIQDLDLVTTNILVENRPGASGAIGYKQLADQHGNPYTLGTVSVSFFTTPLLGASPVNYEDFTPIAAIAMSPYLLVVRSDSDIKSMDDLLSHDRLSTSTVGVVSDAALLSQMLQEETGTTIDAVPFDGEGDAMAALLGKHIDFMFGNPGEVLPQVEAGKLRAIAVSTDERIQSLPDVPTLKEQGLNVVHTQLRGIVMPAGVPQEAVHYWENVLKKVANSDEWKEQYLNRFKDESYFMGADEFTQEIAKTNNLYKDMMTKLGLIE
ncbi:tripartite tricarboxylate transporter substrate binding protein [Salinicola peritrichatus]|uniref:tripartite tricarboxylate transporter substrate binding protein n=1 Tax=Salinicola peritrichatus TaxID=1267424 RepID=UPI000DA1711E|nr:tripartite tricarboxylate transporter substrate binding protein [Salinicola peritrichatus]